MNASRAPFIALAASIVLSPAYPAWAQNAGQTMPGMPMPAGAMPGMIMPDAPAPAAVNLVPPANPAASSAAHRHEDLYGAVLIDQLEYRGGSGSNIGAWEGQAYYGGDYDKIWLNTRGEYNDKARSLERAELQILYSRLISYFWNAQIGVRQDFPIRPNEGTPARTHLVLGVEGLLPNLFEVNFQVFVDHRGTVAARLEGYYDAYITQRLVLQPQVELNAAANADRQSRLGSGFTRLESGLRLRYELTREFAPYVGVQYERVLGETASIYKRTGEQRDIVSGVAGIRLFF